MHIQKHIFEGGIFRSIFEGIIFEEGILLRHKFSSSTIYFPPLDDDHEYHIWRALHWILRGLFSIDSNRRFSSASGDRTLGP